MNETEKLKARIKELEKRIHESCEVYIGMEGFKPRNAEAAYVLKVIDQMYNALLENADE